MIDIGDAPIMKKEKKRRKKDDEEESKKRRDSQGSVSPKPGRRRNSSVSSGTVDEVFDKFLMKTRKNRIKMKKNITKIKRNFQGQKTPKLRRLRLIRLDVLDIPLPGQENGSTLLPHRGQLLRRGLVPVEL